MANVFMGPVLRYSGVVAGAGLTATTVQYRHVKFSGDNTVVLCSATTDVPCGILQAPVPAAGEPAEVVWSGETMVQADASVAAGAQIATSADGQAQTAVQGQYVSGVAVNVAGATTAGTLITALVNFANIAVKA